jgi:hypothetical protein
MFITKLCNLFLYLSFGCPEGIFVGTQDLCVQSNPAFHSAIHPDGNRFIGPGLVGLDAKILRPYKQMIRFYNITLILSNMDSDTSET